MTEAAKEYGRALGMCWHFRDKEREDVPGAREEADRWAAIWIDNDLEEQEYRDAWEYAMTYPTWIISEVSFLTVEIAC